MRIEHTRRVLASRRSAGDFRYTFESGHSVTAQYLSLWATKRQFAGLLRGSLVAPDMREEHRPKSRMTTTLRVSVATANGGSLRQWIYNGTGFSAHGGQVQANTLLLAAVPRRPKQTCRAIGIRS